MTERRILTPRFDVHPNFTDVPIELKDVINATMSQLIEVRYDASVLPLDEIMFITSAEGITLCVDIFVPDRAKPEEVALMVIRRTVSLPWKPVHVNGPDHVVRWLRETIANLLAHESDESITLRGVRVFDPHRSLLAPTVPS